MDRYDEVFQGPSGRGGGGTPRGRGRPPGRKNSMRGTGRGQDGRQNDDDQTSLNSDSRSDTARGERAQEGQKDEGAQGGGSPMQVERESSKRTVEERSPVTEAPVRNTKPRLNEFDLGELFGQVEEKLTVSMAEAVAVAPPDLKEAMRAGMEAVKKAVLGVMNGLSDGIRAERLARETVEYKLEDRAERLEARLQEVDATLDSLTKNRLKLRTKESIKDMEKKVSEAQCSLKLLDVDVGRVTEDRREIVKRTIDKVRQYVQEEDLRCFDHTIRRTRIVILGKGSSRWERDGETEYSVPTLFQCRDRRDTEDLEQILRRAGYFPSFHWPKEIMEFVGKVREEVEKQGFDHRDFYFRVRPEVKEGGMFVKAEVKPKTGAGRFSLRGLWSCPPLDRLLWDDVQDIFTPKWAPRG